MARPTKSPNFPEDWPPEARQLHGEFVLHLQQRIRSASVQLPYLSRFLHYQGRQGLSYAEFPPRLLSDYWDLLTGPEQRYATTALRNWLRFLYQRQQLLLPLHEELPKQRTPVYKRRGLLSYQQILSVLDLPDLESPIGMRDRAILEVAYGSGLRRGELIALDIQNLDLAAGLVHIEETKNSYSRIVPLTRWSIHFVDLYLREARPLLTSPLSLNALWLSSKLRKRMDLGGFNQVIRKWKRKHALPFACTLHQFRHAFATHLLTGGAPLVDIQALLGHRALNSTAIYTQMTTHYLAQVHRASHPRNRDDFGHP